MTEEKSKSPKSRLQAVPGMWMQGEQKLTKWSTATIFNYVLSWTPSQNYGLLTVSNKQLVIASMSSVRWSHMRQTETQATNKKLVFVYVCLMNGRLRGGDKAGEDQGVAGEVWEEGDIDYCIYQHGHNTNNAP